MNARAVGGQAALRAFRDKAVAAADDDGAEWQLRLAAGDLSNEERVLVGLDVLPLRPA